MLKVPSFLMKRLYIPASLRNNDEGFEFRLKNQLGVGYAKEMLSLSVDGENVPLENCFFRKEEGEEVPFTAVSEENPFTLEMNKSILILVKGKTLSPGLHMVEMRFQVMGIGEVSLPIKDEIA